MRLSIRYQLVVPLIALLLGVVGLSTWLAVRAAERAARRQIETQMRNAAHTLSVPQYRQTPTVLNRVKALSGADYLLTDESGRVIASTFTTPPETLPPNGVLADDWESLQLGPAVRVGQETYLAGGVRLHNPETNTREVLYLFYPKANWRSALWKAIWPALILGAIGALASVVSVFVVAQRLTRRIQELERRSRLIAAGDFSSMPLPRWNDELQDLTRSINEMAQRLAQLQEAMKKTERLRLLDQVGGGLAHQLRNGVTGARLAVQLHARECSGPAEVETLQVALRQLSLVEERIRRFLDLGRSDSRVRVRCSLAVLIDEAVALHQPQCRHAGIHLRWQMPNEPLEMLADPGQLEHLFVNVIGNAIEAAGPGGSVVVQVRETADATPRAIIEVRDSGSGPPAEVAERMFEPFVTGKPDGVGLGLAVARQAAEAHGGRITWQREGAATCFRIELV